MARNKVTGLSCFNHRVSTAGHQGGVMYCAKCGQSLGGPESAFCAACGASVVPAPSRQPRAAQPTVPPRAQYVPSAPDPYAMQYRASEKSSGIALILTILWPGAGSIYLGLTKKGTPYAVANAIGAGLGLLTLIRLPISFIVWIVTLLMTVGSVSADTEIVNQAIREGRRITEV